MKKQLFILSLLLLPILLAAQTQNKFFVEPIINPLLLPLGSKGLDEYGLGYSDFEYKESATQEYALLLGMNFFNGKWNAGIGISHKKYRIDYNYAIRNPLIPETILLEKEDFLDYSFYGLRLFTSYQISDKLNVRLTIEPNEAYRIERENPFDLRRFDWIAIEVDGEATGSSFMETNETIRAKSGGYGYVIPELNFSYTIYKKLNILLGAKYRHSDIKDFWIYRLYIYEIDGITSNVRILNDSRIYLKSLFLYAGISYQFGFGKKNKDKIKKKNKRP